MPRPARLDDAAELIDQPAGDTELQTSLDHVAAVNRWLGGTRALLRALEPLLPPARDCSVLDVGTGSGDLPRALVAWGAAHGRRIRVVGADRHPQTIRIAHGRNHAFRTIAPVRCDVLHLPFRDRTFDFALISLTLHHLDAPDRPAALRELARVARRAVLVNELERSWPNYLGAKALSATVWRRNRLTRHDAPLSVLRAFAPSELTDIAAAAGLARAHIQRRFFYRLVLVADLT
jgi:SAM-dependent methyltransferase